MAQPMFEVTDLKKYYRLGRGAVTRAVDGVSFSIYPGEIVGVVGAPGCGQPTRGRPGVPSAGRSRSCSRTPTPPWTARTTWRI